MEWVSLLTILLLGAGLLIFGYALGRLSHARHSSGPTAHAEWMDTLKEAEATATRLAAVVEQAQEIIEITDLKGNIVYVNPYFESTTGYSAHEAIGNNPSMLSSGVQDKSFYQALWTTIRSGKTWQGNLVNRRKDGSLYDEAATIFPIKNAYGEIINFAAVKRDITESVAFERAIQQSEKRYRLLADNATDVIWTMDLEGRFTYISPSVKALRGYTSEEAQQQHFEDALMPQSAAVARQGFSDFLQAIHAKAKPSDFTLELEQRCKDGGSVWTESLITAMYDDAKQIIGALGVTRDISARKDAEEKQKVYARQQELLTEITQAAIAEMDFQAMLQVLADRLGELLTADGCYITLWDDTKQQGIPAAAYGPLRTTYPRPESHARPEESTFTRQLYKTRQALVVPDALASPYIAQRLARRYPSRSLLGLPLIANQRFLGAALISFHDQHDFTEEEIRWGERAAQQIALALLKAQLLAEAQRRATEAETLRLAGAAVAGTLHQQEAIERVLNELKRVVPYDSASVMLLREGEMEIVGENGFSQTANVRGKRFPLTEGTPNAIVYQTRQPYLLEDAPLLYEGFHRPPADQIRGWLGVPVLANEAIIGMITLDSHQSGTFTQEHVRLASAFADQVAIALENSRLFEETQRLAISDSLTGLFNRRHFMDLAQREYERAQRYQKPLSLLMLDIDHFKKVNDTYGHLAGDLALQVLSDLCRKQLRTSDIIGRYGGEELIVLLPETASDVARAAAERLRQQTAAQIVSRERSSFSITISLGLATLDPTCKSLEELIDRADQALYRSKKRGRNLLTVHTLA
ncbi:MAG: diguanylate cyclase [Chloroflexota bacterium]